ncbi:hypothetical protein [Botrimarina sp.]|uniref:hypothetical protein n=1 Tax=Botrimarina sp. TaxID=2795802 RepID=UPI0032EF176F
MDEPDGRQLGDELVARRGYPAASLVVGRRAGKVSGSQVLDAKLRRLSGTLLDTTERKRSAAAVAIVEHDAPTLAALKEIIRISI